MSPSKSTVSDQIKSQLCFTNFRPEALAVLEALGDQSFAAKKIRYVPAREILDGVESRKGLEARAESMSVILPEDADVLQIQCLIPPNPPSLCSSACVLSGEAFERGTLLEATFTEGCADLDVSSEYEVTCRPFALENLRLSSILMVVIEPGP